VGSASLSMDGLTTWTYTESAARGPHGVLSSALFVFAELTGSTLIRCFVRVFAAL
jgi:hypothetical protein